MTALILGCLTDDLVPREFSAVKTLVGALDSLSLVINLAATNAK